MSSSSFSCGNKLSQNTRGIGKKSKGFFSFLRRKIFSKFGLCHICNVMQKIKTSTSCFWQTGGPRDKGDYYGLVRNKVKQYTENI